MRFFPLALLLACGGEYTDGSTHTDTGHDTQSDTGEQNPDSPAIDGWGDISGDCGILTEQNATGPASDIFLNSIDLEGEPQGSDLTPGGQEILEDGNAGGSSIYSEIMSYEVLARCERAQLVKTENEISYDDPDSKKTDLLIQVNGVPLGVSVTRAIGWPREDPWGPDEALALLEDKFGDVQQSSSNVSSSDRWVKQILHVIAYSDGHADSVAQAYQYTMGTGLIRDTLLMVTVTDGEDAFIY